MTSWEWTSLTLKDLTDGTAICLNGGVRVLLFDVFVAEESPGRQEGVIQECCSTKVLDGLLMFAP
jgi:hypothetical protein